MSLGWPQNGYVAEDDLELLLYLSGVGIARMWHHTQLVPDVCHHTQLAHLIFVVLYDRMCKLQKSYKILRRGHKKS